jgi:hypothetical protein
VCLFQANAVWRNHYFVCKWLRQKIDYVKNCMHPPPPPPPPSLSLQPLIRKHATKANAVWRNRYYVCKWLRQNIDNIKACINSSPHPVTHLIRTPVTKANAVWRNQAGHRLAVCSVRALPLCTGKDSREQQNNRGAKMCSYKARPPKRS